MEKSVRETIVSIVQCHLDSPGGRLTFLLGGAPLSEVNWIIFQRCLESWLILIEDLMLRLCLNDQSRRAKMTNFVVALRSSDLVETLSFLDAVYAYLIEDTLSSPDAFKQYLSELAPETLDYKRLLSPINSAIYLFLIENDKGKKAQFLSSIAQFLRFPKKLDFKDIGLEAVALEAYKDIENELESVQCDDWETIQKVSDIIAEWFKDFHIENLRPIHGSGSVAEGPLTLAEKFGVMQCDKTLKVLLRNPSMPSSYLDFFPIPPGDKLERCSRTIFVPKTATKLRTISMEPATLQYIQQGVMYELYKYIEKHPYLGMRIKIGDQTQNQILALEGSRCHNYGTIDLSHASDSVSWDLVRKVFRATPRLYKWLLGTRSSKTILPDGELLELRKFAPMGSALCFPIECILFAAIVECASRNMCSRLKISPRLYSVYGDDLVVQSEIYDETVRLLVICGFSVNTTKSYNRGEYRESCGKEYYAGFDISALYYRTPFYRTRVSPSAYGSWCSAANNAVFHRLPLYRWFLLQRISACPIGAAYFTVTPQKSPQLYSPQPTNFHTKASWSKRYQRWEGKFVSVKSKPRGQELDDDTLSYFIKLIEMSKRTASFTYGDEPSRPYALHGCVEYFSSTTLPIVPYHSHDLTVAQDW